jgi:hypothetical protein
MERRNELFEIITYLLLIFEAYLSDSHASVLFEIRPWCINDSDVIFLVTYSLDSQRSSL